MGGSQESNQKGLTMRTLVVRSEAEQDLSDIYKWYECQRPGLGDEFLLRIEAALESMPFGNYPHDFLTSYSKSPLS